MQEQIAKSGNGRRPPLEAFNIIEREGLERPYWQKIGVGWVNRDGSINVQLDSLPIAGKVQLREYKERADKPVAGAQGAMPLPLGEDAA